MKPLLSQSDESDLVKALVNLIESSEQADADFCGEQREWHLPRLHKATGLLTKIFPLQVYAALQVARTPYGKIIED